MRALVLLFLGSACTHAAVPPGPAPAADVQLAGGRVVIKPRLKYELGLSLHVLATAEDHHKLFVPWAQRMRSALRPQTLQAAGTLIRLSHEWPLCNLLRAYDGPDDVAAMAAFLERD